MENYIIKNVLILDVDKDVPSKTSNILISNGTIQTISESPLSADGATEIDGFGMYVLPGLIDCHAHPFLAETNISKLGDVPPTLMTARAANILNKMILRGFTTIRDATGADWGIKKAVEDGEVIGPRLFISGRALSQTGGHGDFRSLTDTQDAPACNCAHALAYTSRVADGVDEVRKAVREELRQGADQIKIMVSGGISSPHDPLDKNQYSPEEIRVIVAEAERRGTYVMAHAYGADAIKTAVECGVKSIEHGNLVDDEAAALMAKKGAFLVPTLITYKVLSETASESGWSPEMISKLNTVLDAGLESIRVCKDAGVKIGFGTDLLGDSFDHQSEEFLVRSEVESARETIKSATKINAELLNQSETLGCIAEGYTADLILLNENPFDDVHVLLNERGEMKLIMKDGEIIKNSLSELSGSTL